MEVLISTSQNCAPREPLCLFSIFRAGGPASFNFVGLWIVLFCLGLNTACGQTVSHEYPLKAVFLVNFAQFTDWPTNAFGAPDSPLVIGVLGNDPFGKLLDEAVQDESIKGRELVVKRYQSALEIKTCHILFISHSEASHLDKIVAELKGKLVLTVSEIEDAADRGACVQFVIENNRLRLRINLNSLREAGLVMSSQLLRVSEIVATPPK